MLLCHWESFADSGIGSAAGYKAIFLSVDTPCLGRRLNEYRNNFRLPDDMSWPNLLSDGKSELMGQERGSDAPSKHDFGNPDTPLALGQQGHLHDYRSIARLELGHPMDETAYQASAVAKRRQVYRPLAHGHD